MSKKEMLIIGNELGMEIVSEYEIIDIDFLKFNKEYQRAIERRLSCLH